MKSKVIETNHLVRDLFSSIEIILFLLILTVLNFIYQYTISQNIIAAILFGFIGGFVLFNSIILKNRKTKFEQKQLKELNKYASCVVLKLKSNQNVVSSIYGVLELLEGKIKKDVQLLFEHLENNQEIKSEHFLKYHFSSINVFHQILEIQYFYGGKASELFHQILKDIAFEIKKRDELSRKKSLISIQLFLMTGIVASLPLMLKFLSAEIYHSFLTMKSSLIILFLFHFILILHIHFFQKAKNDISIRI